MRIKPNKILETLNVFATGYSIVNNLKTNANAKTCDPGAVNSLLNKELPKLGYSDDEIKEFNIIVDRCASGDSHDLMDASLVQGLSVLIRGHRILSGRESNKKQALVSLIDSSFDHDLDDEEKEEVVRYLSRDRYLKEFINQYDVKGQEKYNKKLKKKANNKIKKIREKDSEVADELKGARFVLSMQMDYKRINLLNDNIDKWDADKIIEKCREVEFDILDYFTEEISDEEDITFKIRQMLHRKTNNSGIAYWKKHVDMA